jgi:hypothetical protein
MDDEMFCGYLCMAARKTGVYLKMDSHNSNWYDMSNGCKWSVPAVKGSAKASLVLACRSLQNYFNRPLARGNTKTNG